MSNADALRDEAHRHVAAAIRRAMTESGMTQVELARRSGVTQPRISSILSGDRGKISRELLRVLEALGLTLDVVPATDSSGATEVCHGNEEGSRE